MNLQPLTKDKIKEQGLDAWIAFHLPHSSCPLGNLILISMTWCIREEWESALVLHLPIIFLNLQEDFAHSLRKSCVLESLASQLLSKILKKYIERGFAEGWIKPQPRG
jgi:glutamate synthase (NADPH/NADH) small chain